MGKKFMKIGMVQLVTSICDRLQNKFSVELVIEGKRGLGKSTLAWNLAKRVKREMKKRGIDKYNFKANRDLLYTQKEVMKFLNDWYRTAIADEYINVVFNRDFYSTNQKDIIKMMNMNRDHCNCLIACVPSFKTLDSQVKNMISMRITVVRRGLAILHTPNKTIYSKDIWDEAFNEKIERKWLEKGLTNPKYSNLTTCRGYITFPKMSDKDEMKYQEIKNKKRNLIAGEKGLNGDGEEEREPIEIIYDALINGKIKSMATLEGMGLGHSIELDLLKAKLQRLLRKNHKPTKITSFFYDLKENPEMQDNIKRSQLDVLLGELK
jgi:hypothetical protein